MSDFTLDATNKSCPIPVLETRKMIQQMESGQELMVIVDYPPSKENIIRYLEKNGHITRSVTQEGSRIFIVIQKGSR